MVGGAKCLEEGCGESCLEHFVFTTGLTDTFDSFLRGTCDLLSLQCDWTFDKIGWTSNILDFP